ncbi:hypothetical protein AG0111_0g11635 [Alternaria gaisen]|uniref:Uncharacterized protein n=1 Tax=Alternaria gaisen TaxID=167740 RepID=A0ACB6F6E3_9PLEO|nr:hypothetical protein AG0111_0g11635 [Alternaria gaisen]
MLCHQFLLLLVFGGLTVTSARYWKLSIRPPHEPKAFGIGFSDKAYQWARGGLIASRAIALFLSAAALVLSTVALAPSTRTELYAWTRAMERNACVSLALAECVASSLIIRNGELWLFCMVCVCSLLNLPLAFVPPVLEHVGYTGHDEWYFHLPAIFIALVVCAVHSLLLLRQTWSQDESTPLARRTGIRFCIMSASEAIAFLALTGFFFCNKQLYEDLPVCILSTMTLLSCLRMISSRATSVDLPTSSTKDADSSNRVVSDSVSSSTVGANASSSTVYAGVSVEELWNSCGESDCNIVDMERWRLGFGNTDGSKV